MRALVPLAVVFATVSASVAGPSAAPAAGDRQLPVTLSKTGTDLATGSTTQTGHGDTVRWVVSATNPDGAPVDATITDVIQGGPGSSPQAQTYVPGSLQAPPGFTKEWSTDHGASFSGTDQGTATNVVQARNPELASPATGLVVSIPPPFEPINTATGGDGFTPILYTATINGVQTPEVWNIYHHGFANPASVVCTDLLTNGPCPTPDGAPATWPQALNSSVPGATTGDLGSTRTPTYVQIGSKLYYAAISRTEFAVIGVGCIDLQTQASCGFTELQNGTGQVIGGVVQAPNQNLYAVSGTGEILCYDAAANAPCGTFDIGLPPNEGQDVFSGDYSGIMRTIEGKIYVTDNTLAPAPTVMSCFDPSTNAACAGWATPKTVVTPTTADEPARADNVFEMYDAAGTVTGVCTIVGGFYQQVTPPVGTVVCFDLAGNPIAAPPGLTALVSTNVAIGEANFQVPLTITAPNGHLETEFPLWIYRGVTPTLNSTSYCYDWTIQGPCAQYGTNGIVEGPPNVNGGNTSPYGYAYDGQCKYSLGDTGYLFSLDPVTGASPCQKTRAQASLNPAAFYCDGATGHVRSYGEVSLLGVDPSTVDFTQSTVTVLAADGSTVGTFPFDPGSETADISTVPIADSPIQVVANITLIGGGSFPPGSNPRMQVTFVGDAPQICFETTVGTDCSVTAVFNQATAVTDGQTPVASNTVTLQVEPGPDCTPMVKIVKEVCASTNPGDCGPGGPGPWGSTTTIPPGGTAYWRITVSNAGPSDVSGVTLTDPVSPSCAAGGPFDLPAGTDHQIFCDLPGVTQDTVNTVWATYITPDGTVHTTPQAEASVVVAGAGALAIEKTPDSPGPFREGDVVSYTYTVTNTGTAPMHNIIVIDDHVPSVVCDRTDLNPGESTLCHGSYVVTAADVPAGQVTNTAHAEGTDSGGLHVVSPPVVATVPVVGVAKLDIEKRPDNPGPFHLNEIVDYTYTVTNTGTATVHNLIVFDDHVPSVVCGRTDLNPGESTLCHGSYVVTPEDVKAGHVMNTARASGLDPLGEPVESQWVVATVPVVGEVLLVIEKTPDSAGPFRLGDAVSYTYTVTNTGTAPAESLAVIDDRVSPVTCSTSVLQPGESTLCHGAYTITAADVTAGQVTNVAHAEATDQQGQRVSSPPTEVTVPVVGEGRLEIEKTPDSTGPFRPGDVVSYTYTVTNTGTGEVHNLIVTDDHVVTVTCDSTLLLPGESTKCRGSYVVTEADAAAGLVVNTAQAEGTDQIGQTVVSPSASALVLVLGVAELVIEKTADSAGPFRLGETVFYTYTVTNTGTTSVHNLTVIDDHVAPVTCPSTVLNPGESTLCHGSYVITAADVAAGKVTNTAHAEGTDPLGQVVQSPPASLTVPVVGEAVLHLEKTPDSPGPFRLGDTVTYTYTVTNTGTAPVHDLVISDDHPVTLTCDRSDLAPGESALCHGSYVVTAADVSAGKVTNTAEVKGLDPQGQTVVSPPAQATVPVVGEALLAIEKTADSAGPFRLGDSVGYTYTVTNTGTAEVHNLIVVDDHVSGVGCDTSVLLPGQSTLCHGNYVITEADVTAGQVTNTAHAEGTDPLGLVVQSPQAQATVPVVGEVLLLFTKTPDSVGPFRAGDVVSYTYKVTNAGTAALHNLVVTDDHIASVTCDTTTVNPGESTLCHGSYVVTQADVLAGDVVNTARVEGTDPQGETVLGPSAQAVVPTIREAELVLQKAAASAGPFHVGDVVPYTYTVTNTGTAAVTGLAVTDDHIPAVTCDTTTLNPGESTFCHGSYVITAADEAAGSVTNKAVANGTDPVGQPVQSPPAEATINISGDAQLTLSKVADSAGPFHAGDTVTYTYTVTNAGTATVNGLEVIDNRVGTVVCNTTVLAPGESTLCHSTYVVSTFDVPVGHVTNTAYAGGTDPQGQLILSPVAEATIAVVGVAELSLRKVADSGGPFRAGDTVTYTYFVRNSGTATVNSLTVADDHVVSVTCDATTLAPGESTTCHGSYVVSSVDVQAGHVTNTAHAEGTDPQGQTVLSALDSVTVPVVGEVLLTIEKIADGTGPFHLGDTVSYTYTVTNAGTATVSGLGVVDDRVTTVTCDSTTLAPGESTLCHGSYVVTAADVQAGKVTNTAHAEGTDPQGQQVVSPPVEATVPVVGVGALTIEKTPDSVGPFHLGETVHYTYTVTNTGTAVVNALKVADDHVVSVTCDTTVLNPGDSTLCHGSYVVTAADVTAGQVTNTARAEGTDPQGQTVLSPPASATVPVVGEVLLTIEKIADGAGPFHLGETVHYTYTVTNTGTAVASNVKVLDDHVASVTCDATTLAPGTSTLCHGSYVVTAADVQAGKVTNTAHAEGTDPQGQQVVSPPVEATIPVVGIAELTIAKTADSAGPFHAGDTVTYTYTVTNTGTAAVNALKVADDHVVPVTCDATTLAPGESTLCHGTYVVSAADVTAGHVTNTARAEGTDPQGQTVVSPQVEATVPVVGEGLLTIEKIADSAGPFRVGDTVAYTYTVTNTGTAPVSNLTVVDDHVASVTCDSTTLAPGTSMLCHGSYVITAADVTAGHVTNTAHAAGTDPQGQEVVSPPVEVTVQVVGEAQLAIQKSADTAGPFHAGDTVSYTYTVTNTGTATVSNLTVADDHVVPVTCDSTTLNPGASTLCHGTYVVTAADVTAGHVTNTARAEGTDPQGRTVLSPQVEATVPVVGEGLLTIEKIADSAGPFHLGDTVSYTYTVTNTGTAPIGGITVVDDHVASVTCDSTTLNPGASTLCHGSYVVTAADVQAGKVTNTAHAEGTDPHVVSPSVEVTVPVTGEAQLSVTKKADASGPFRAGDVVRYTYTVTNTGSVALHDVAVSDDRVASVVCDARTLDPGRSTVCHGSYVVTEEDVEAGRVTNTAHASGTDPEGRPVESAPVELTVETVSGASSLSVSKQADVTGAARVGDTVTYTYTVTNTGSTVLTDLTVRDDRVASVSCEATRLEPGASTTCRGTYLVTAEDAKAGHVTNTAKASARDPQGELVESGSVELCVAVSQCPEEGCVKPPHQGGPAKPPHGGEGGGHLPDTGSPAVLVAAGLAGGGLLTLGGVLLHRARRRADADRFTG
ncbi:DUF7507 domain-containing protein [Kitasatospora sp. NPDC004531]